MSSSDGDDSLLDFHYIPKGERDRQRQEKALSSSTVTETTTAAETEVGVDTNTSSHARPRKRPRTVYEQERDAKVSAALQSSGAGALLDQVQRQDREATAEAHRQQQEKLRQQTQAREDAEDADGARAYRPRRGYARNAFGDRGRQDFAPRDPRDTARRRPDNVSMADWNRQQAARQNRWLVQNALAEVDTLTGQGMMVSQGRAQGPYGGRGGRGGYMHSHGSAGGRPAFRGGGYEPRQGSSSQGMRGGYSDRGGGYGMSRSRGRGEG